MEGYRPDNVISGTWGELWLDDDYMAEIMSFKAEIGIKYSDIQMALKRAWSRADCLLWMQI